MVAGTGGTSSMKLSSIQVDRFGVWRDLDLTIPTGQVAVLSGPNGTGKSTLLEFVRG
ncbi:MAG: ATP-binding cassette domain-containing protein, partial [Planctomycetaceae bacterium]